jgi:hypothetical protein
MPVRRVVFVLLGDPALLAAALPLQPFVTPEGLVPTWWYLAYQASGSQYHLQRSAVNFNSGSCSTVRLKRQRDHGALCLDCVFHARATKGRMVSLGIGCPLLGKAEVEMLRFKFS